MYKLCAVLFLSIVITGCQGNLSEIYPQCDFGNEDQQLRCIATAAQDESICDQITLRSREYCITNISIEKNDIDMCSQILDWDRRAYGDSLFGPYNQCITAHALHEQDPNICSLTKKDSRSTPDACFFQTAQSIETCNRVHTQAMRENCFARIAADTKNITGCVIVEDMTRQNSCLKGLAVALENEIICDSISKINPLSIDLKGQCYRDVAAARGDPSICSNIVNNKMNKQMCLGWACENSEAFESKDDCLQQFR